MARQSRDDKTKSAGRHRKLVEDVGLEVRQLGAQSVVTSQIIAGGFGLHTTDLECLDLIYLRTEVSAGDLAKATGLSSGSVTALIDRLEGAGYVERIDDPHDRRRVLVRIKPEAIEPIKSVYMPMQKRMFDLWSRFSARDLAVIIDFLRSSREASVAWAGELARDLPPQKARNARRRAPSG